MPRAIDIAQGNALLRSRDAMLGTRTERELRAMVTAGAIIRVHRGWYVDGEDWRGLWNEGRHLVRVLAVARAATGAGPVFCGVSAAVVWGLPLYRLAPKRVHVVIVGARHGRTRGSVVHHSVSVLPGDIVEVDGIRCTSLDRTVLDLACSLGPEAALSSADAALRRIAVRGQRQDEELAHAWRARIGERAATLHVPGARRARELLAFADGRAQLPGESVSRLHLRRLGFTDIGLQARVVGPAGEEYWLDFAFGGARAFGEFDGKAKYLSEELRGERTAEMVVLEEKAREDAVRGVTEWRVVRWGWDDIASAEALGARLAAFGVRPT
ncbi:hypothetical protein [Microbacterium abyssi]|uniref:hypothetical protein n=1 Tax=Microbacterium abyssi TaxID=2782166 RepID=UPI0018876246|nr:hypothetical protein [Microbacterium sp. A18JL241]